MDNKEKVRTMEHKRYEKVFIGSDIDNMKDLFGFITKV